MSCVVYSKDMTPDIRVAVRRKTEELMQARGYIYTYIARDRVIREKRVSFYAGVMPGYSLKV